MNTVLITGGNCGMGFQTAKALALKGWKVWIGCRSEDKGKTAAREINRLRREAGNEPNVKVVALDLSSFSSVQACAQTLHSKLKQLDVLICNAGVMYTPHRITENGFELQFQVNYLGHYLLTHLLLPLLEASADPRVISISSKLGEKGTIDDLASLQRMATISASGYEPMASYRESKFAQMLATVEFQRKEGEGGIRFAVVHPGVVKSSLFSRSEDWRFNMVVKPMIWLGYLTGYIKSTAKGAETAIFLSTTPDFEGGQYWVDKEQKDMNSIASDKAYTSAFWSWSMDKISKFLN